MEASDIDQMDATVVDDAPPDDASRQAVEAEQIVDIEAEKANDSETEVIE